ncbi:hypothetical protein KC349_g186 [Hortaea werneckii]|nr:hypothetical protein KC349_g186 [Hortaea werneckii]
MFGSKGFRASATPEIVPPVPAPATKTSSFPCVVGRVLELVGEEAAAGSVGVVGVLLGSASGEVDELLLVDDRSGFDALDETSLQVLHSREGDACRADSAFIDSIATVWHQQAFLFCPVASESDLSLMRGVSPMRPSMPVAKSLSSPVGQVEGEGSAAHGHDGSGV